MVLGKEAAMPAIIRFSILATLVLCCVSVLAQTVEPLGSFDIKRSLPPKHASDQIAVRSFVADDSGLYFLIDVNPEHPPIAQTVILHTDSKGTREKLIVLHPPGFGLYGVEKRQYGEINVDSSGNIYLSQYRSLSSGEDEKSFVVYGPKGGQTNVIGAKYLRTFCLSGDNLFYIDGVTLFQPAPVTITKLSTNQDSLAQWEAYGPLKLRALTSSKLVVLELIDSRLQIVDLETGSRTTVLLAPISKIQEGIASHHPDEVGRHTEQTKRVGRSAVVNDIGTNKSGDIYLNVMGHPINQGAVIVRVDSSGNFSSSTLFKLPTFEELKTEHLPEGQMFPNYIGVSDKHLFIAGNGKVARYPI